MRTNRIAITVCTFLLLASLSLTARSFGASQYGYGQDRGRDGWDAPPQGLQEMLRQGFRDGIIGAQEDFDNHRRWNPNNRDEFRHPNLP
jgi:hypothetical protein